MLNSAGAKCSSCADGRTFGCRRSQAVPAVSSPRSRAPRKSPARWRETAQTTVDLPATWRTCGQIFSGSAPNSGSSRSAGLPLDRLFVADGPGHDVVIHRAGRPAIESEEIILGFRGDHFVPIALFAGQDIERGLCADDLAGRSDQRRIAHFFSDARNFIQDFFHPVERILLRPVERPDWTACRRESAR